MHSNIHTIVNVYTYVYFAQVVEYALFVIDVEALIFCFFVF